MIKYTRLKRSRILLELTIKRLKRKIELIMKKPMPDIIQKINHFKRKLNFFDYIIIFLLFVVIAFFAYSRLQRNSTLVNVRVSIENLDWWYQGIPPSYWYLADLKKGEALTNSFGKKIAEVVNVDNYDLGGYSRAIYVDLKMEVDFDKKKNQYLYEFKPLVTGSSLVMNFANQQLRGIVISVGEEEIEYFYKTIKVEVRDVEPSLADKVLVGVKSYDTNGEVIAEILDAKKTLTSYYTFSDIRAKKIEVVDPEFRDLEIVLKVKSFRELDREFYINKAVLKIGAKIWFQFEDFALEDTKIIEIVD